MCPLYPQTAEVAVGLLNKLFDLAESLKLLIIFYSIIQFVGFISRPVRCHLFHHSGVCRLLSSVCSAAHLQATQGALSKTSNRNVTILLYTPPSGQHNSTEEEN